MKKTAILLVDPNNEGSMMYAIALQAARGATIPLELMSFAVE